MTDEWCVDGSDLGTPAHYQGDAVSVDIILNCMIYEMYLRPHELPGLEYI